MSDSGGPAPAVSIIPTAVENDPFFRQLRAENERLLQRKQVLRRAGWRCETCGRRAPLDVHHLTYERFGNELLGDLRALCRECHDEAHRKARGRDPSRPLATPRRYQRGSTGVN